EIEVIYERNEALFSRVAVDDLRVLVAAAAPGTEEHRRRRMLLDFAVEGHLGLATKTLDAAIAGREAELSIEVDGQQLGFRESAVVAATDPSYGAALEPQLRRTLGLGLAELRRSDLPRFFRAPEQDDHFPAEKLVESFVATARGLGIDARAQPGVVLDVEPRPKKSPRA